MMWSERPVVWPAGTKLVSSARQHLTNTIKREDYFSCCWDPQRELFVVGFKMDSDQNYLLSLRCCVCVSPAVSHGALLCLKGEVSVCIKTSPPRCRMCSIAEKHTFQDRTDVSCDFQNPFIEVEGEQYLRVIFSAVRMCSMVQFQG